MALGAGPGGLIDEVFSSMCAHEYLEREWGFQYLGIMQFIDHLFGGGMKTEIILAFNFIDCLFEK